MFSNSFNTVTQRCIWLVIQIRYCFLHLHVFYADEINICHVIAVLERSVQLEPLFLTAHTSETVLLIHSEASPLVCALVCTVAAELVADPCLFYLCTVQTVAGGYVQIRLMCGAFTPEAIIHRPSSHQPAYILISHTEADV